jgi:hypothetical protein
MRKIELPDRIFGKDTNEALKRVLNGEFQEPTPELVQNPTNTPTLNGFVYVPSAKIWLAKKRSLNNESWNGAIKQIYEKGDVKGERAEMSTPFEFMSGLIYILDNKNIPNLTEQERAEFLDDTLKTGEYRGNHLNARFGDNVVETATIENGKLKWKSQPLETTCLQKNCYVDVKRINAQGLFTTEATNQSYIQGQTAYFWKPVSGYVARFDAYSDRADLNCIWHPDNSYPSLGVRLVVRSKSTNSKVGVK